jgi:hypothetical protein
LVVRSSAGGLVAFYLYALFGLLIVATLVAGVMWLPTLLFDLYAASTLGPTLTQFCNFGASLLLVYVVVRLTRWWRTRARLRDKGRVADRFARDDDAPLLAPV